MQQEQSFIIKDILKTGFGGGSFLALLHLLLRCPRKSGIGAENMNRMWLMLYATNKSLQMEAGDASVEGQITTMFQHVCGRHKRDILAQANHPADDNCMSDVNGAEAIKKYKDLLDDGIITKEEFEEKKRKLLRL